MAATFSGRQVVHPAPRSFSHLPARRFAGIRRFPRSSLRVRADASKYDYVVVGGGTAGCVLANRLTADGSKRVLVLEAGPVKTDREVTIPAGITRLFKSALDWNIYSREQHQLDDRDVYLARGKVIGGSSCTNATLYMRGSKEDYDGWGVENWSGDDVLEWFKKSEDNERGASEYHSKGGIMHVENPRYRNKLFDLFFGAAEDVGMKPNPDFNDWSQPQAGYGDFQVTQKRGRRADMFRQALLPIMDRSNLDVVGDAVTSKIVFESGNETQKAVGVEYVTGGPDGEKCTAELEQGGEVLLCAGAIHSPTILMLSGIGPGKELQKLGIDVAADIAGVGQNLQDHPACLSAFALKAQYWDWTVTAEVYNNRGGIRKRAILNYLIFGRGPLGTTGCDRGAFVSSTGSGMPDLQLRFPAGYALDPDGVSSYVRFGELLEKGETWPGGITFQVINCRPVSRGTVGLMSPDPFDMPDVDIQFLSDPKGKDMAVLRAGLRLTREMANGSTLAPYLEEEGFPGLDRESDDALDEYIKQTVHSANAIVGSCKMGLDSKDGSVVDADLKVHGVDGLRVIDASVMPIIPGGQTGAPVVMIAERAADLIMNGTSLISESKVAATVSASS